MCLSQFLPHAPSSATAGLQEFGRLCSSVDSKTFAEAFVQIYATREHQKNIRCLTSRAIEWSRLALSVLNPSW